MKNLALNLLLAIAMIACSSPAEQKSDLQTQLEKYKAQNFRPMIHYSPDSAWMNDPNGMVYFEGEYHLFYQYYPDSTVWGPMHWGHAVSTDMLHWEHLPIALYPDDLGYIFSGSAVIDWNNTTGFQNGDTPPMVAIFTHHEPKGALEEDNNTFQYQSLAYSLDKGRTWTKYEGNPVLNSPNIRDFRDPKVSWHEQTQKWIMTLAVKDRIHFYASADLKDWIFLSEFGMDIGAHGGVWECPDLFELKVEGTNEKKWVLLVSIGSGGLNGGSATQYFVGDFDGNTFTTDQTEIRWIDHGRDNYAGVTWSDIPASDGRRLFIGWMSNWQYAQVVPTKEWRSAMTLPRTLSLNTNYELVSTPVDELRSLEENGELVIVNTEMVKREATPFNTPLKTELTFDLSETTASKFGIELTNNTGEIYQFGFDQKRGLLFSDRTRASHTSFNENFANTMHIAPFTTENNKMNLEIYLDRSSIEIFVNNGERVMTELLFPSSAFNSASIFYTDGEVEIIALKNTPLKSIWDNQ